MAKDGTQPPFFKVLNQKPLVLGQFVKFFLKFQVKYKLFTINEYQKLSKSSQKLRKQPNMIDWAQNSK